jgi:hypothetical protein
MLPHRHDHQFMLLSKVFANARHPNPIQSNGNNDGTSQNLPLSLKNPPLSFTLTSRNVPTDWLAGVAGPVRLALPCPRE